MISSFRALARRRALYRECFATEAGKAVLADLARFCGAGSDLLGRTREETDYNVGKHRVLVRIFSLLEMDERDAMRLARQTQAEGNDDDA